jgi:alpha-1,2-mannosyltransferase
VLFFLGLWLFARSPSVAASAAVAALAVALLSPLYESFFGPTAEPALVGLLGIAYVCSERDRPLLAGLALAVAVHLKLYPALFLVWFALAGSFRTVASAVAWTAALGVGSFLIAPGETALYFLRIVPLLGGVSTDPEDVGSGRLLAEVARLGGFHSAPWLAAGWKLAVVVAAAVATVLPARRGAPAGRAFSFAAWAAFVLLVIPVCWANYQLLLAPLFVALAGGADPRLRRGHGWLVLVAGATSFVLLAWPLNEGLVRLLAPTAAPRAQVLATTVAEAVSAYGPAPPPALMLMRPLAGVLALVAALAATVRAGPPPPSARTDGSPPCSRLRA